MLLNKGKSMERNLFDDIDLQIMICNERIKNHKKSIEKAKKMCGWNGPNEIGGMDYSQDKTTPNVHISFDEAVRMIDRDEEKIRDLMEERKELRRRKKHIKKIYENLKGYEGKIYYNRIILNRTQEETAREISLSTRQEQRIESDMRDRGLM